VPKFMVVVEYREQRGRIIEAKDKEEIRARIEDDETFDFWNGELLHSELSEIISIEKAEE
jgi:hypothetical protein